MSRYGTFIRRTSSSVIDFINKVFDAPADLVETAGNAFFDGFSWLAGKAGIIGLLFIWAGGVVSAATDLAGSVIKAVGAITGGIPGGIIRIAGSIFALDWRGIACGFGIILSGITGGIIVILGKAIAFIQLLFMAGRSRPVNNAEKSLISLVFRRSLATYNIRVVDGHAGLFSMNPRAFVLGNTIYMKGKNAGNDPAIFIHECVHIWQNQHLGSRYTSEALASQYWGAGYNWEIEAGKGKEWMDFEPEAQAKFIEDVYRIGGTVSGPGGKGAFFAQDDETLRLFIFNRVNRTAEANSATNTLRNRTPWRLSMLLCRFYPRK